MNTNRCKRVLRLADGANQYSLVAALVTVKRALTALESQSIICVLRVKMQHKHSDVCKLVGSRCPKTIFMKHSNAHIPFFLILFRGCHLNIFFTALFISNYDLITTFCLTIWHIFFIFTDKQCSMTSQTYRPPYPPKKHSYQHTGTILLYTYNKR